MAFFKRYGFVEVICNVNLNQQLTFQNCAGKKNVSQERNNCSFIKDVELTRTQS